MSDTITGPPHLHPQWQALLDAQAEVKHYREAAASVGETDGHGMALTIKSLREELARVTAERDRLDDLSLCRLQLPDGRVPGNTEEALTAWHRVAVDALRKLNGETT